ncbi:NTP transferase domain-containing protein [Streptomyces sp. AC495_CC817]|uniref:nucleotidyltransferase family protein n=1 Tax=Streptomyces sp. AC495_CC817 TaxID=2823900 RepID=UPI001C25BE1C|nr:nucleotidyltransferase family protein [Streptomyces sp. AC495_CC817]
MTLLYRHAIVLAAGSGSRLGRGPKALLPWNHEVLVTRVARVAALAGCSVTVAVGPEAGTIRRWLRARSPSASTVYVRDASLGMSASLRAAVRHLASAPARPHVVVVLLVDQPGVDETVVSRLLAAHRPGRATRASWRGIPGTPVVFDTADLLAAAAIAHGDSGARTWMSRHPHLVDDVECADLGSGADVDTPGDLAAWPQLG